MSYIVGSKGQIVIDKGIRDRLGVQPGWRALQLLVDDRVEIRFVPPEHSRSLAGSLSRYLARSAPDEEAWRAARSHAWTAATGQRMTGSPGTATPGEDG